MKKSKKANLSEFQILAHGADGKMIGGFSVSLTAQGATGLLKNQGCTTVNNCNGGNCTTGCSNT